MDYEFDEGPGSARRLIEGIRGWLRGSHTENSKTRPGRPLPVKDVLVSSLTCTSRLRRPLWSYLRLLGWS